MLCGLIKSKLKKLFLNHEKYIYIYIDYTNVCFVTKPTISWVKIGQKNKCK